MSLWEEILARRVEMAEQRTVELFLSVLSLHHQLGWAVRSSSDWSLCWVIRDDGSV